mmetsp:Transcript_20844/g.59778  ORF Transcript_20844/g.59778 Transcript_20844/m.59778 type:complete len:100 (+) Transcript_20844:820-1119(+)
MPWVGTAGFESVALGAIGIAPMPAHDVFGDALPWADVGAGPTHGFSPNLLDLPNDPSIDKGGIFWCIRLVAVGGGLQSFPDISCWPDEGSVYSPPLLPF